MFFRQIQESSMNIHIGELVAVKNYGGANDTRVGKLVAVDAKGILLHSEGGQSREWRRYSLSKIGEIIKVHNTKGSL